MSGVAAAILAIAAGAVVLVCCLFAIYALGYSGEWIEGVNEPGPPRDRD